MSPAEQEVKMLAAELGCYNFEEELNGNPVDRELIKLEWEIKALQGEEGFP